MPSWRLTIVCEDRRTERFLRRLCERYEHSVQDVVVAPSGRGDASEWVKKQYPGLVKKRRSKNYQHQLGLLVCVDGDELGVLGRHRELSAGLEAAGLAKREPSEPVAVFVPTWSIESWLATLCGYEGAGEAQSIKDDLALGRALWADGSLDAATCKRAAELWRAADPTLPSLQDAYREAGRIKM